MVDAMLAALRYVRAHEPRTISLTERLRRAGYADGERRPRLNAHWTNR
jgi:hypothetical protein